MSDDATPLVGKLLIAMPTLADPNFWHAVVLVGVHSSEDGAFGLVINRPLDVELTEILDELGENVADGKYPEVLAGGPVEPNHGFVLFEGEGEPLDDTALTVATDITVSGSTETLANLARRDRVGGNRFYLLLGYSGWYPGQLEREIEDNSWLVAPLDLSILFDTPLEERWTAALRSIGVEPGTLVDVGPGAPS